MIIGLDVGGTHIDAVLLRGGHVLEVVKIPYNPSTILEGICEVINKLTQKRDLSRIERVNLSTTISTNAVLEGRTSPVGMILESGPGVDPSFVACGKENFFLDGYIDHRGHEVAPFREALVHEASRRFKEKGISAVGVVTKFSVRNPSHEIRVKELLDGDFYPVTMGHALSGKLNFPRRVFTAYLNSAVYERFTSFASAIRRAFEDMGIKAPINVLKADGGTMSLKQAISLPVHTILSGPAASVMGCCILSPASEDAVIMDVGGTTTDISFLAGGVPLLEKQGIRIGAYPTLVRAIFSFSIALGGDSAVKVADGRVVIGPRREGPPAALGGPEPTPSDAMIVKGLLDFGSRERAYLAMKELGFVLKMEPEVVAEIILEKMGDMIKNAVDGLLMELNSRPVYTVRELLYGKRIEPREVRIIGGPAKALAPVIERKLKIPCVVPDNYQAANAIGAALSRTTAEITLIADTARGYITVPELGIRQKIDGSFTLKRARSMALKLVEERAAILGASPEDIEAEIIEESCFNMVRGFYTVGKNIRVKAQVKPGLTGYGGEGREIDAEGRK
ncbi:hydantoinase/oxoprolinase family protein [Thermosediminibacter litoriperuensis]|uniref:N-methylhydantoinase A/oxoprolinase/acetone carboxylase beta subunit n=1 Tax=Thermosediminibacter litoriperuensis TaxID=291989 RepID=A0A5S5AUX2_9FIRM|nr:hydantoinase/oxoprolinase family protein [Thermosediminibacter litoriperuensis]TYP56696.1 N-methylhydantoinase A/oxoprolinase/acetone carboxylase beta subunit [Thermosediminibacter litoriperuensis]